MQVVVVMNTLHKLSLVTLIILQVVIIMLTILTNRLQLVRELPMILRYQMENFMKTMTSEFGSTGTRMVILKMRMRMLFVK